MIIAATAGIILEKYCRILLRYVYGPINRFIREGHAEIKQLKASVAELKNGFDNLEVAFKKVSDSSFPSL